MRSILNLFFATSLLLSSSASLLEFTFDKNNVNSNTISNVDPKVATEYANKTSIVAKSLLIGKDKGFKTNTLLNNMYKESYSINKTINIDNLTSGNSGNDFINDWTSKLDGNSINTIQSLFQSVGINQSEIDNITNKIDNYSSYSNILPMLKIYFKNHILANDKTINTIHGLLKTINNFIPNINDYLSYVSIIPTISDTISKILANWDQEENFIGNTTFEKMKDYISKQASFAQAWNIPNKESYFEKRAKNWNWNQFYEYIAGANFNYMFKLLSGKYIGEMISDNIEYILGIPKGFNSESFNETFINALNNILINPAAWPYLIKTIIPIVKSQVLKLTNPTLSIDIITWDDSTPLTHNTLQLKKVLSIFQKIISSKSEMIKLFTSLIQGPFGEDIIVKASFAIIDSYWTLSEFQSQFSFFSFIKEIPEQIVNSLQPLIKKIPISETINKIFNFTDKYLTTNPLIDLKDLVKSLGLTFASHDFIEALNSFKYIINDPTADISKVKEILKLLGVQFDGEVNFKEDSVFSNFSNLLEDPTSSLSKLFNIIVNKEQKNGILDNMLKEQVDLNKDMYSKYFDINNNNYFTLSNIVMNTFKHSDGNVTAVLSYKIKNNLHNNSYDIIFKNDNFYTSNCFKIKLFHISQ